MNEMFNPVVYKEGESKEAIQRKYLRSTGIYDVTVESIQGYASDDGKKATIIMSFVTAENELIQTEAPLKYTDKSNKIVAGFGEIFIQTLLRFSQPDKKSVTAMWLPAKLKVYGKDVDGHEITTLKGLKLKVYATNTRSTYTKQNGEVVASEKMVVTRLFTTDGLTQTELEKVKNGSDVEIKDLANAKAFLTKKLEDGRELHDYRKTSPEEWKDINDLAKSGASSTGTATNTAGAGALPGLDDLPTATTEKEPSEATATEKEPTENAATEATDMPKEDSTFVIQPDPNSAPMDVSLDGLKGLDSLDSEGL